MTGSPTNNNTGTQRGKTEKTGLGPEERVWGLFFSLCRLLSRRKAEHFVTTPKDDAAIIRMEKKTGGMSNEPILIVDDEVAIAQLIAMTLARMGCTCQMAFDGLKAAELLEKNEYDLVLLDNKNIALYRDTLHERVWGRDAAGHPHAGHPHSSAAQKAGLAADQCNHPKGGLSVGRNVMKLAPKLVLTILLLGVPLPGGQPGYPAR